MSQTAVIEAAADAGVGSVIATAEASPVNVQSSSPVSVVEESSQSSGIISTTGMATQALDLSVFSTPRPTSHESTSQALNVTEEPCLGAEAPPVPRIQQESPRSPGTLDELCIGPRSGILQGSEMIVIIYHF